MDEIKIEITTSEAEEMAVINSLAKDYYYATQNGDKPKKIKSWEVLYRIIVENSQSNLNKKLFKKVWAFKLGDGNKINKDTLSYIKGIISDLFTDLLFKYDYERSENFYTFLISSFFNKLRDERKHDNSIKIRFVYLDANDSNDMDETSNVKREIPVGEDDSSNPATAVNLMEIEKNARIAMISTVLNFYDHNKGKSANEQRFSYYKIFFTEKMIERITDTNSVGCFNSAEVYNISDKNYVRFISYSEYKKIEDILNIRYKLYSEVIDGYDKEDKRINVPCENVIIQQYRYKSGLDSNKVSLPNITQQRMKYKESLEKIYNMIGEG